MAFGDMNQGGFNNFNSKRQTGRVKNMQAINMNPPMAPQFSSFYGNNTNPMRDQAIRQQQLAQMQPPPPPVQGGYNQQAYNNYFTNTGSTAPAQQIYQQPNAPIPPDLYKSIQTYGSQFFAQNPNPPAPPMPAQPITSAGSPMIGQTITSPATPMVGQQSNTRGSSSNAKVNIPPDEIAFYKSLYMTLKPSDTSYAQVLTPTKYGGTFGDSYGAGFDKWFEQNYLRNSSIKNKK